MDNYKLKEAFLIYRSDRSDYYFQRHNIYLDDGKPRLGEGSPVTKEALQKLCRAVLPNLVSDIEYLDNRILATSGTKKGPIVWWVPQARRPFYFKSGSISVKGLAPYPALVMIANNKNLDIFAVKGDSRPEPSTELYLAPFPNMTGSNICLGNAERPSKVTDLGGWERAVFESSFSEVREEARIKGKRLVKLWHNLIINGAKTFPENELIPEKNKVTLGVFIKSLKEKK